MSGRILITYASRTGATADIAGAIGENLRSKDIWVAVCHVHNVLDLHPYRGVVIGSAIQNRQWLPEAMNFVERNQEALRQKSCAIFTVCMTLAMRNGQKYRPQIAEWVAPVRQLIQPTSEGFFPGILNIKKIPSFRDRLKFRLSVAMGIWAEGDHRDWAAVQDWSNALYAKLRIPEF